MRAPPCPLPFRVPGGGGAAEAAAGRRFATRAYLRPDPARPGPVRPGPTRQVTEKVQERPGTTVYEEHPRWAPLMEP